MSETFYAASVRTTYGEPEEVGMEVHRVVVDRKKAQVMVVESTCIRNDTSSFGIGETRKTGVPILGYRRRLCDDDLSRLRLTEAEAVREELRRFRLLAEAAEGEARAMRLKLERLEEQEARRE